MTMDKFEPKRGWLLEVEEDIPRSSLGDPNFESLEDIQQVFRPEQLVYIVNRFLYSQTYQRDYHKKRSAEERDRLAPIKRKVRKLFSVSYLNATDEQIRKAITAVKEDIANG
jgi:hypothetical protein